jgi:hypothetical protein
MDAMRVSKASTMGMLLFAATAAADAGRLWMRVSPGFAHAPAAVRVDVVVERHEDNRALEIVVDSGEYYRRSTIALNGAAAARFHTVQYRSMPAGAYDVFVAVTDSSGAVRAAGRRQMEVLP